MQQAHLVLVRQTVQMVVRRLEHLPPSDRASLLRACAADCAEETELWSASPPTPHELDVLAKRLFFLHVEATKLERSAAQVRAAMA